MSKIKKSRKFSKCDDCGVKFDLSYNFGKCPVCENEMEIDKLKYHIKDIYEQMREK